jgi:hypothetical protein
MNMDEINRKLEKLERHWFETHRSAKAAREEIAASGLSEAITKDVSTALRRLEKAERLKKKIMRRIEAIEDSLIE